MKGYLLDGFTLARWLEPGDFIYYLGNPRRVVNIETEDEYVKREYGR